MKYRSGICMGKDLDCEWQIGNGTCYDKVWYIRCKIDYGWNKLHNFKLSNSIFWVFNKHENFFILNIMLRYKG